MRRREFITLLGGAAAPSLFWPLTARAQQPQSMLIGMLAREDDPAGRARVATFVQKLRDLGWIEGRNLRIENRWAGRDYSRLQSMSRELVSLKPNVIVTNSTPMTQAVLAETSTIPIVFAGATDPLASGLVKSLARPGGNVTGFTNFEFSVGGKWLELLTQIAPKVSRALVLMQSGNEGNLGLWGAIEKAAPGFSVQTSTVDFNLTAELERALATFAGKPDGGLIILPNPSTATREVILEFAKRHALPAIYPQRQFALLGGLLSYGYDELQLWRNAALYADRILKGEKPGDLPIQQPTDFALVINLKTAKAFGLTVPNSLLATADEVIE